MITMLVRKNKFIYEFGINIKSLHMFEMKRYILSSVEKKRFTVCFNRDYKSQLPTRS